MLVKGKAICSNKQSAVPIHGSILELPFPLLTFASLISVPPHCSVLVFAPLAVEFIFLPIQVLLLKSCLLQMSCKSKNVLQK